MPDETPLLEVHRKLARKISEEASANPQSPYAGKYVGMANGQVVVVADNWNEVVQRLDQVEPDPQKTFCLEVDADYDKVVYIGGYPLDAALRGLAPFKVENYHPASAGAGNC